MSLTAVLLTALAITYGPDQPRYDVDVTHTKHRLTGTETIRFHNPFDAPLDHVWIRRWDQAYTHCTGCTKERIALDPAVAPDGTGSVTVGVNVRVPARFDRFGSLGRIDLFGNGLPILAVSVDGAEPRLPAYTFLGESFFSLTAAWRVDVTLQPGERVASTGRQIARAGQTVTLAAPRERDFMIVAGPMTVTTERRDGVRVRWFARRGVPEGTRRGGVRFSARALAALQRRLGAYGAPEFDVVQTPVRLRANGVAMEYPQLIISPPARFALTHETAHQWFYRLVGNDEFRDPWVDETLTSFAAARLGPEFNGDYLRSCRRPHRPVRPPVPVDSGMPTLIARERATEGVIFGTLYRAGPCALLDLQRRIGERRMTAFLRALVRAYRDGVLTSQQLRDAIAELPTGARTLRQMRIR
jgi:hypothetical protein